MTAPLQRVLHCQLIGDGLAVARLELVRAGQTRAPGRLGRPAPWCVS